ncbi:MAG: ribose-phosphate pyrophosphokinase-like domain-containing protein, partial [Candidatus Hadarchaeota archaeon]
MIVVAGSASPKLSARVARQLKCRLITPEIKRFPDGELYIRIPQKIDGERAVIVQST